MNQDAGPISGPTPIGSERSIVSTLVRCVADWGLRRLGRALILLNVLALIGHFVRGRVIWLELLLYFPLVPLGAALILAGTAIRGLGSRKEGSTAIVLGIVSIVVSSWWMIGRGPHPTPIRASPGTIVRILHWNVLWGGLDQANGGWASIVDEIVSRAPDVIILSEAAPAPLRRSLIERLGASWSEIAAESEPRMLTYKYGLVVLSRWPMRFVGMPKLRNGTASEVIVKHPNQPIRLLTVDGKSRPTIPRSMMLDDIAAICEESAISSLGPIDVVAGDFNCVGRTRGFDRLRATGGGYSLASEASTGWRATWPSWLPIYDIDHVWVRNPITINSCTLFSRYSSDHRGQVVELTLPQIP